MCRQRSCLRLQVVSQPGMGQWWIGRTRGALDDATVEVGVVEVLMVLVLVLLLGVVLVLGPAVLGPDSTPG